MDKKLNLGDQAKGKILSTAELFARHKSLVSEYFVYMETNKPEILKIALREQIEKIENMLRKKEILT